MEQHVELQHLSHRVLEPNPALARQAEARAKSIENRIADRITAFAGSMPFVYIHAKRQVIADQQWQTVEEEDRQNEELLGLSHQILELTKAIHAGTAPQQAEEAPALGETAPTE